MAGIFNRAIFNDAVFNTAAVEVGHAGGRKPWKQAWRQELVEILAKPKPQPVPKKVERAIQRVLEAAPADDTQAKVELRRELETLRVGYRPRYLDALRWHIAKAYEAEVRREQRHLEMLEQDDEEVILLLH